MADKIINIPIGSGDLFEIEFTGTIPDNTVIETEANRIGRIEKGASIQYKPTTKKFKDDYGFIQRTVLTEEEVILKASLVAWSSANMDVFSMTGRVTESAGRRTIKIGGLQNASGKKYLWRFVHPDPEYGDIRITIVGTNTGGFTLSYKPDDSGNLDLEITAEPSDNEGTLILYDEQILGDTAKASGLTVSSAAGSTSGTTKLTITPSLGSGNSYHIFHGAEIPAVSAVLSNWTVWNGTSDITSANGDILTVAEVDGENKAVKAGIVTVTSK